MTSQVKAREELTSLEAYVEALISANPQSKSLGLLKSDLQIYSELLQEQWPFPISRAPHSNLGAWAVRNFDDGFPDLASMLVAFSNSIR